MWFILGLAAGFANALYVMASKKILQNVNPRIVAFGVSFFTVPILTAALLIFGWVTPTTDFWPILAVSVALNATTMQLLMRALKTGELSVTVPFLSFTPLFLVFTSRIMVGESPSATGLFGILAIVAGSYTLQFEPGKGILGPFNSFYKNRSAQLALLVAFLYAIGANIDKMGVKASSPVIYPLFVYAAIGIPYLFFGRRQGEESAAAVKKRHLSLFIVAILLTAANLAYLTAMKTGMVPYVISLKRTSAFWSVIFGYIVFKEKNVPIKMLGAIFMVIGVLLIALG